MQQLGIFREMETKLNVGDQVSVVIPWPGGPERRNADVMEIREDCVHLQIDYGSGWKVEIEASPEAVQWYEFGGFWHIIWGSADQQRILEHQISKRHEVLAENKRRRSRGLEPLKTKVPVYI